MKIHEVIESAHYLVKGFEFIKQSTQIGNVCSASVLKTVHLTMEAYDFMCAVGHVRCASSSAIKCLHSHLQFYDGSI